MQKVTLLRALDGKAEGDEAQYTAADAKRLAERGLVKVVEEKQEKASENKAERAPANKSKAGAKDT